MIRIADTNLWVGSAEDEKMVSAEGLKLFSQDGTVLVDHPPEQWAVLHACKVPYHKALVGHASFACPKDHPEYLVAHRPEQRRMALNMIDVDDVRFQSPAMIYPGIDFLRQSMRAGLQTLVHCNQGASRGPAMGLMALASTIYKGKSFDEAEEAFREIYPTYAPKDGIRDFARYHWFAVQDDMLPEAI